MLKKQKGITLIALIITIIVMLILVGVTINVALNGGLFKKAEEATKLTQIEAEKEELLSAVVAAIGNDGKVDFDYLDNNLPTDWSGKDRIYTSPKRNTYTVDEYGKITKGDNGETEVDFEAIKQDVIANPEVYLAKAKAAGQDIETTPEIGIGTDGEVVNLDLWNYLLYESDVRISGVGSQGKAGYKGTFNNGGAIEGTIPQYVYSEGSVFPVTQLYDVFYNATELTVAPKIPESVTDMYGTFYGCTGLTSAPKIPESVIEMDGTFSGCTGLTSAPKIPESVTDMDGTFSGCTGLTSAPEIPKNVVNMKGTFSGCSNLKGTIIINSDVVGEHDSLSHWTTAALNGVGSAEKPIILKGTGNNLEILEALKSTGNSEYITIEQ